jgi:hypothetical protein
MPSVATGTGRHGYGKADAACEPLSGTFPCRLEGWYDGQPGGTGAGLMLPRLPVGRAGGGPWLPLPYVAAGG